MKQPRISIAIPFHFFPKWEYFMMRCLMSIEAQTFKDYEIILIKHSTMPVTSNRAIESAKGDLIKVLYVDDYLAHENSLQEIVDAWTPETKWLVTGCVHDTGDGKHINYHEPKYTKDICTGTNGIGSPSVLTLSREAIALFDTNLSWLLDCELYHRLYTSHGLPTILNTANVVIGIHPQQTSNTMPDDLKQKEQGYLMKKYA